MSASLRADAAGRPGRTVRSPRPPQVGTFYQGVGAVERHFEQELEQLKSKLLTMSALVESAVYRSITAVVHKDRELAEEVLQREARVNWMQIEIDEQAVSLLA